MNLWKVDNKYYVISDGPAGAVYLAKGKKSELVKMKVEKGFRPRLITNQEAQQIING